MPHFFNSTVFRELFINNGPRTHACSMITKPTDRLSWAVPNQARKQDFSVRFHQVNRNAFLYTITSNFLVFSSSSKIISLSHFCRLTLLYMNGVFLSREAFRRACLGQDKRRIDNGLVNLLWLV